MQLRPLNVGRMPFIGSLEPARFQQPRRLGKKNAAAVGTEKAETYLGENFTKHKPAQPDSWVDTPIHASPIKIQYQDHTAIRVKDVEKSIKFYTKVLGFKQIARPDFPFGGGWLVAGGITLHLIEQDPSVDFTQVYQKNGATVHPEQWHIRRSEHKAFQVENLQETEQTLIQLGVEFHKFIVPGTNAAQIFLFDPDYNGIELGANYAEIKALIDSEGRRFLEDIREINTPMIASLEEMSVMLNLAPSHGYALRGRRAVIAQPSRRTVSYMLTLVICPVGILYRNLRSGPINAEIFSETLKKLPDGITLLLDNARVHHASKCLVEKDLPTVAQIAASKSMTLKSIPAYAPHLNPVEFTFNTVRNLLRRSEAWTESRLMKELNTLFRTRLFAKASMQKLFRSVLEGGPNPGERLNL